MDTLMVISKLKTTQPEKWDEIFRFVYRQINAALREGKFAEVDLLLSRGNELPLVACVAVLCYTATAADQLPSRNDLWEKTFTQMEAAEGRPRALACLIPLKRDIA